jgi:hypothetical protein
MAFNSASACDDKLQNYHQDSHPPELDAVFVNLILQVKHKNIIILIC